MKIGIACDHRAYDTKEELKKELSNYEIIDYGTNSSESVDYPHYALTLATSVKNKEVDLGIVLCGSGIGVSIACNKVKGIRCAKVNNSEEAKITRIDNNSNVVAFGEKISLENALEIVETFINTDFSTEEKHHRRVNKIIDYEENNNEW